MEALAGACAAGEAVEVFLFAVCLGNLCSSFGHDVGRENLEVGFDHVSDVAKEGGGTLLAFVFDKDADGGYEFASHGGGGGWLWSRLRCGGCW